MSSIGPGIVTIFASIIGLAMVAVVVSQKAQTSNVLKAGGSALAGIIGAAVAPVSSNSNLFGSTGLNIGSTSLGIGQ